jgi:antitoxin PrlF
MDSKSRNNYSISPAKIGSQDGFRLPRAFSKDHPELIKASGYVEVLNKNTLLVRLNPQNYEVKDGDDVKMSLFLDLLMEHIIENPDSLVPYTEKMSQEVNELLAGVSVDEDIEE